MRIIRVKKNRHYGTPFPFPWPYVFKKHFRIDRIYEFDESIRYNIDGDQMDVNKLFGISYGLHHNQSDRIGFRYNIEQDKVEIVLYSYELGKRDKTRNITFVDINEPVRITLEVDISENGLRLVSGTVRDCKGTNGISKIYKHKNIFMGYSLGLYFGGNRVAPHEINIKVSYE